MGICQKKRLPLPGPKLRRFNQGSAWALQTQWVTTFGIVAGKWEITKIHHLCVGDASASSSNKCHSLDVLRRSPVHQDSGESIMKYQYILRQLRRRSTPRNKLRTWPETTNKFSIESTQIIHIHHRSRTRHQDCEWPDRNGADGSTRSRDKAVEWTPQFTTKTRN